MMVCTLLSIGYIFLQGIVAHAWNPSTTEDKMAGSRAQGQEAGEMPQRLRALAALPEILSSIPSNHVYDDSQSSIARSGALFWHAGGTLYI